MSCRKSLFESQKAKVDGRKRTVGGHQFSNVGPRIDTDEFREGNIYVGQSLKLSDRRS